MHLDVTFSTQLFRTEIEQVIALFLLPSVDRILETAPSLSPFISQSVVVSFIGQARMKSINASFRGKQSSTDILSFEIHESGVWGELYISPRDVALNAHMMKHSFANELTEIIVHGLLHLSGLDHSDDMFAWQNTLTQAILSI